MKNYRIWILFLLINITAFASDQYIYSQIHKENLVVTDQYAVEGFTLEDDHSVQAVGIGNISLKEFLESSNSYDTTLFEKKELERYEYTGEPKSMVEFKLVKDMTNPPNSPSEAKFSLTLVDDGEDPPVYRRLVDENYMIPAPITNFKKEDLESSKNTFTYDDLHRLEHLIAYKYQEVVFRLYTGTKSDNLIPLKEIQVGTNLDNFYSGDYVDFVFENNGTAKTIEKDGIIGKFIDGKFELMGLEDGKTYYLDFYTLRYRGNTNTGNYVAVTYEESLKFIGKNKGSIQGDTAWLEDADISNYKEIALNVITVTNDPLTTVKLKDIKESRVGVTHDVSDILISTPTSLSGSTINIGGTSYDVVDNQITVGTTYDVVGDKVTVGGQEYTVSNGEVEIDGVTYQVVDNKITIPEKKYVYKWVGTYETSFIEEEGKERTVEFYIDATNISVDKQMAIYVEPVAVAKDTRYPHQHILFDSTYSLKNQKYNMVDRILTPARDGYRQIKSIAYDSDLEGYLHGDTYSDINNFTFENNKWSYPANEGVEGFIVEKTISDAKAEFVNEDNKKIKFYTDDKSGGIIKVEESGDKVVYNWSEGPANSNGVILNYDKVIFRLVKMPADGNVLDSNGLPIYYWNPYENNDPINYLDDEKMIDIGNGEQASEGSLKMEAFLFGNTTGGYEENYVDLVFDASADKEMTFSNAVISYEGNNNNLRIIGLPVGEYFIEFYTVKRGHDATYKVITYENNGTFSMDIPEIASEEFAKQNNVQKIDFITTSTSNGAIQVNVNFITKMERQITLTADNLESLNLPSYKIAEQKDGDSGWVGIGDSNGIKLQESDQRRFLFPLDIVFVIDNSGSMQNEIDAVKDGLDNFGQELYNRGFDVKYNLITFGPPQEADYQDFYAHNSSFTYGPNGELWPTGNWHDKIDANNFKDTNETNVWNESGDANYMAIYKDKWFNGSVINKESSRENDLEELIDAFDNINAVWGYTYGQENSAWGIHYAIKKLRANGRYLDYSGEITSDSNKGYMPSQKMIIFLTDENMDTQNLPNGYTKNKVLKELYAKLNNTFNSQADNI